MPVKIKQVKSYLSSPGFFFKVSVVLSALALVSALGLDYLSFKHNETAYLPWAGFSNHPSSSPVAKKTEKKVLTDDQKKPVTLETSDLQTGAETSSQKHLPYVAIIIDDMGQDLGFMQELINLQVPLTVAILPDARQAMETAELAANHQIDVLIHLPLEAFNGQAIGAGADGLITTTMSQEEIWARLEKSYERLPVARGLNNHMGSKGTANQYLMEIIIEFLKQKNLFFVDSKTSAQSIAYDLALKKQVPAASRQVFLDADEDRNKIKDRLFELFTWAKKNGQAIGIGHPFEDTLRILKTYLPEAKNFGVQLATCSRLIAWQEEARKTKSEGQTNGAFSQ